MPSFGWGLACCALVALSLFWVLACRDQNWVQAQWRAVALASFTLFMVLNQNAKEISRRLFQDGSSLADFWQGAKFQNTLVSLAHAIASSALCCVALGSSITSWEEVDVAVYAAGNPLAQISGAVTLGYNIVDIFDAVITDQAGSKKAVIAHHVLMSVGIIISNTTEVGELFLQVAFLCELNCIFLHCRTLMRLAGFGLQHAAYAGVWAAVWLTMVVLRLIPHAALVALCVVDSERLMRMSGATVGLVLLVGASFVAISAFNVALTVTLGHILAKEWGDGASKRPKTE